MNTLLPTDKQARKELPIASGVLDYFPAAIAAIAQVSKVGNDQHNPGQPLHHARGKSMDHADTMMRHFVERGAIDTDGLRHSAKMAWRALALLQQELEDAGAPLARGAWPEGTEDPPAKIDQGFLLGSSHISNAVRRAMENAAPRGLVGHTGKPL